MVDLELVGARVESRSIPEGGLVALRKRMRGKIDEVGFIKEYISHSSSVRQDRVAETMVWLSKLGVAPDKVVVLLWSGGLDSTGLLGYFLSNKYAVIPVYLATRHGGYLIRELAAIKEIWQFIKDGSSEVMTEQFSDHLSPPWYFDLTALMGRHQTKPDLVPDRNKLLVEFVIEHIMDPLQVTNLGAGEYTGSKYWVVDYHVPAVDCEPTSFVEWVGDSRKFICLDDTGMHAVVKSDRLEIGINTLGASIMGKTTCCLSDTMLDCGMCYGCVERAVAWDELFTSDPTQYVVDPRKHWLYNCYSSQHDQVFKSR